MATNDDGLGVDAGSEAKGVARLQGIYFGLQRLAWLPVMAHRKCRDSKGKNQETHDCWD